MTKSRNINRPRWKPSEADKELLRRSYADTKTADLAQQLGVAYHQVCKLARRLGLEKSAEFMSGPDGNRADGLRGESGRFKKGCVPWTKGKKGLQLAPEKTRFKPGQHPRNWQPVGSLRMHHNGYLQIKATDTGNSARDWVMYHRHVWEQAHGPIPAGHIVVFKGQRLTQAEQITPDVLECITKREHMARHTFHQYGPEIAQLVQLRSALARQINKKAKEAAAS